MRCLAPTKDDVLFRGGRALNLSHNGLGSLKRKGAAPRTKGAAQLSDKRSADIDGVMALAKSLAANRNLRVIDLAYNRIQVAATWQWLPRGSGCHQWARPWVDCSLWLRLLRFSPLDYGHSQW